MINLQVFGLNLSILTFLYVHRTWKILHFWQADNGAKRIKRTRERRMKCMRHMLKVINCMTITTIHMLLTYFYAAKGVERYTETEKPLNRCLFERKKRKRNNNKNNKYFLMSHVRFTSSKLHHFLLNFFNTSNMVSFFENK